MAFYFSIQAFKILLRQMLGTYFKLDSRQSIVMTVLRRFACIHFHEGK